MNGFLGTGATFRADLNLVVQISMGLALLVGMALARRKNFRAHKYVQSSVMILNLVMIFLIMAPSFHKQVQPQVPGGLREAYYLIPYVHATLGTIAEVLGLYIVLVAATKILPLYLFRLVRSVDPQDTERKASRNLRNISRTRKSLCQDH
jgi:uncharacterized membrane protein YozB (DUF420 family)